MQEIVPGTWHWTAFHEGIRSRVSSYYVQPSRALIDPMLPEDQSLDWFARQGVDCILLTNRHHYRHSDRFAAALGCAVMCHEAGLHEFEDGPDVQGFSFEQEVADGIVAREVGVICPEETAMHILHGGGAMSLADSVVNWPGTGLGFVPDEYIGEDPAAIQQGLRDSLRNLLVHEWDALAVGHGDPVSPGGRAALARFVES